MDPSFPDPNKIQKSQQLKSVDGIVVRSETNPHLHEPQEKGVDDAIEIEFSSEKILEAEKKMRGEIIKRGIRKGWLTEEIIKYFPEDMDYYDISLYWSWSRSLYSKEETIEKVRNIKSKTAKEYEMIGFYEAIQLARESGSDASECDRLIKKLINYARQLRFDHQGGGVLGYPIHFQNELDANYKKIKEDSDFSLKSIEESLDYSLSHCRSEKEFEKGFIFGYNPYEEKGIPIYEDAKDKGDWHFRHVISGKDPLRHVAENEFKKMLSPETKLNPKERREILEKVLPIDNTSNLLFHKTMEVDRVPLIASCGLWSQKYAARFLRFFYGGEMPIGSGWGEPYIGKEFIDVWTPTTIINPDDIWHTRSFEPGKWEGVPNESKKEYYKKLKEIKDKKEYKTIKTSTDCYYQIKEPHSLNYNISEKPILTSEERLIGGMTWNASAFVIKLNKDRYKDVVYSFEWGYVKNKIQPEEIVGLIIDSTTFFKNFSRVIPGIKNNPDIRAKDVIEILGNNIKMPIYDEELNMIWPIMKSKDEILQEKLKEQENQAIAITEQNA